MIEAAEHIPDDDTVSRLIDSPRMHDDSKGLIWGAIFEFPGGNCESVIWSRYASTPDEIHKLGCVREALKRQIKPEMRYAGFIFSTASEIRSIKTGRGHGCILNHAPKEGLYHVEICYVPQGQINNMKLQKGDKIEIKAYLQKAFSELQSHSCNAS